MREASSERAVDDSPSEPETSGAPSDRIPKRESAQSGTRAAPALGARIDAALDASSRAEAALADIFRTAKFLCATIGTVRDANTALARELESLSEIMRGGDAHAALAGRIERLEQVIAETGEDYAKERDRLVSEHDRFLAMLLADHERDLDALRKRLGEKDEKDEPTPPTLRGRGSD